MKILIIGAGRVGASVAESLVSERNDITVIDVDVQQLAALQDRLDLRTLAGNGTQPSVLRDAGAEDADMLIAVARQDETNLVACQIAQRLFNVPTRIARVRSAEFQEYPGLMGKEGFDVDYVICPEQTVTNTILRLIEFPEALQVMEFADGRVGLIASRAYAGGPLVGNPIMDLRRHIPSVDTRIVAIFRGEHAVRPEGDTTIEAGDEVFFLAASEHVRSVMAELRRMDKPVRRVMIAGGGNIGLRLARSLWDRYEVKIVETGKRRCEYLASQLPDSTLILNGDSTDADLLESENVRDMDLFVAVTSLDENNIMACLLAKRLGARRVIALINRRAYAELMEGSRIDIAIVPAQTTIGELLAHIRRGDVVAVHSLRRGAAEALEAIAHGDSKSSKVIGKRIDQIDLPRGATIGAIVREAAGAGSDVIMAHHDTVIEPEDHVIVFVSNKRIIPKVEKLFQVGVAFF
ncbi:MAG: Trk system potassium transporter TrkA [Burkholderiales bacterium]|nr:MAG: Trk system potassium transporter TrkA [Burkholderiales bacterium]